MSETRTDEQILTGAPIVVVFGGAEYKIPVLTIAKSIEWRQKLIKTSEEIMRPLMKPVKPPLWRRIASLILFWRPKKSPVDMIFAGLGTAFLAFPEKVLELVCDYCPDLPRKKILDTATEEELFAAFSKIVAIANPLQRQISIMRSAISAAIPSPSERFTNSSSPSTDSLRVG